MILPLIHVLKMERLAVIRHRAQLAAVPAAQADQVGVSGIQMVVQPVVRHSAQQLDFYWVEIK